MIPLGVLASARVEAALTWTPANLSPILWLDAADTSTITDAGGGAVSEWADKSGNARHFTQSTPAARPILGSSTIGGVNTVKFDGAGDVLTGTVPIASNSATVALVTSYSGSVTRCGFYGGTTLTTPGVYQKGLGGTSFAVEPQSEYLFTAPVDSAGALWVVNHGSDAGGVRINGTQVATGSANSVADKSIVTIGRLGRANVWLNGSIGEFIMVEGILTGTDLSNLESYLMTKWGIA